MLSRKTAKQTCVEAEQKLMMITGVIETFAICRRHRFQWPWFSSYRTEECKKFEIFGLIGGRNWR